MNKNFWIKQVPEDEGTFAVVKDDKGTVLTVGEEGHLQLVEQMLKSTGYEKAEEVVDQDNWKTTRYGRGK